jgi:hypothetical protein
LTGPNSGVLSGSDDGGEQLTDDLSTDYRAIHCILYGIYYDVWYGVVCGTRHVWDGKARVDTKLLEDEDTRLIHKALKGVVLLTMKLLLDGTSNIKPQIGPNGGNAEMRHWQSPFVTAMAIFRADLATVRLRQGAADRRKRKKATPATSR